MFYNIKKFIWCLIASYEPKQGSDLVAIYEPAKTVFEW